MKLGIVGTGAMGKTLGEYAKQEGTFSEIIMIEPAKRSGDVEIVDDVIKEDSGKEKITGEANIGFPNEKLDLLIDFSHPQAIYGIYEYCREFGGNIPVVLATTGYGKEEEAMLRLLEKICPVDRRSNYSQGIAALCDMAKLGKELLGESADIRVFEAHHTKKQDAPSGTAKTICEIVGIGKDEYDQKTACLRMGTVFGEHSVFFAMEDEVVEIRHTAFSKKIFAAGALAAGKRMLMQQNR